MVFIKRIVFLAFLAAAADGAAPAQDCDLISGVSPSYNGQCNANCPNPVNVEWCNQHDCKEDPSCQTETPAPVVSAAQDCEWISVNFPKHDDGRNQYSDQCNQYCNWSSEDYNPEHCVYQNEVSDYDCQKGPSWTTACDPMTTATASGDPHLTTWGGEKYDYHGACDLVLFKDPNFADGLGLTIHIRTEGRNWWSFIKTALVQIGDDTLEVMGGTDSISYWMNGGDKMEVQTGDASLGDFPLHFRRINGHQTSARIDLGHGDAIAVETFKDFVRVNIKNASNKAFVGAAGLLGAFPHGAKVARDGVTVMEDINAFGQEWQVGVGEPMLFHEVGPVQAEEECAMPVTTTSKERRLGEALIKEEDAALACARVSEGDRDACIFDVMATQDKDMAGSY